jgi:D-alanine--poly(phosphoribitol) ligase subunit 1
VVFSGRGSESDFELGIRLRNELARQIQAYMLPGRFIFVDAFPMTPNGKTDRRKLADFIQ